MTIVGTGLGTPGVRSEFFARYAEVNKATWWEQLCTRIESKTGTEKHRFLGSVPPMRQWGTGRLAQGMASEAYDVNNLKYEITLDVDRDELEDDQTGQIKLRISEMAERAARHKDYLIAQLLINGGSLGYNAYDGKTFFATDHESGESGAQSNALTPVAVAAGSPTVAEFRSAIGAAIEALLGLKDDQNQAMSFGATGLVAVIPPSMLMTASEAINASVISSTDNILKGAASILTMPQLSAASTWYLLKTDVSVRPFIFQDRIPLDFTALEQDSDEGFRRDKFQYGVRARYAVTYGYWQFAARSVFTEA